MLGLEEFVVRSQKMKATPSPCHQAQIVSLSILGEPKCSRPAPTLGSMLPCLCEHIEEPKCSRPALTLGSMLALPFGVVCACVFALIAFACLHGLFLVWSHGGRFGSSVTIRE